MSETNLNDPANARLIVSEETWFEIEIYITGGLKPGWVCLASATLQEEAVKLKADCQKAWPDRELRLIKVTKTRRNLDEG